MCKKNILLIVPDFFHYPALISHTLQDLGFSVTLIYDRPYKSFLFHLFAKFFYNLCPKLMNRYYLKYLNNIEIFNFDYLLVINGQTISLEILEIIKKKFVVSHTILYLWDSLLNRKGIISKLDFYDTVYTFDSRDADDFKLLLKPLFHTNNFVDLVVENEYDLFFIGSLQLHRLIFLIDIYKQSKINKLNVYIKVYIKNLFLRCILLFLFLKDYRVFIEITTNISFSRDQYLLLLSKSSAIIDFESINQSGLTIRTIEGFFSGRKIITTNKTIINYEFFDKNSISVIDRNRPILDSRFIKSNNVILNKFMHDKYHIRNWLLDILNKK